MYESASEGAGVVGVDQSSRDLIPMIVEQELRKQRQIFEPKAKIEKEPLTYKYFGLKSGVEAGVRSTPPLRVHLPNQTHT